MAKEVRDARDTKFNKQFSTNKHKFLGNIFIFGECLSPLLPNNKTYSWKKKIECKSTQKAKQMTNWSHHLRVSSVMLMSIKIWWNAWVNWLISHEMPNEPKVGRWSMALFYEWFNFVINFIFIIILAAYRKPIIFHSRPFISQKKV